jgi:hypothetical protein
MDRDNPRNTFMFNTVGDCLNIREGKAPEIFQYEGFNYSAHSTDSFCRLLKAKAVDIPSAAVFMKDSGFHAIVDTSVVDRPQDTITYDFRYSVRAKEWMRILTEGMTFTVREMIDFLKCREEGEIEEYEKLLYAAQNFRYVLKTEGDFTRDNSQNYVVMIRVGEAEGTLKIPERIYINLELIDGSDYLQSLEIEVDIHRPKDAKDGMPGFHLGCPKFARYLDKAKNREGMVLNQELSEFLVVSGSC